MEIGFLSTLPELRISIPDNATTPQAFVKMNLDVPKLDQAKQEELNQLTSGGTLSSGDLGIFPRV